jgi:hypothetical protein
MQREVRRTSKLARAAGSQAVCWAPLLPLQPPGSALQLQTHHRGLCVRVHRCCCHLCCSSYRCCCWPCCCWQSCCMMLPGPCRLLLGAALVPVWGCRAPAAPSCCHQSCGHDQTTLTAHRQLPCLLHHQRCASQVLSTLQLVALQVLQQQGEAAVPGLRGAAGVAVGPQAVLLPGTWWA